MIESGEGPSQPPSSVEPVMPGPVVRKLRNIKAHVNALRRPSSFLPEGTVSVPEDKIDPAKIFDKLANWTYLTKAGTSGARVLREETGEVTEDGKKIKINYEMPLWTRIKRAEILKKYKEREDAPPFPDKKDTENFPDENSRKIPLETYFNAQKAQLKDLRAIDEITLQYLKQQDATVDVPGLGRLSSRYAVLTPPESVLTPEIRDLPPIFLVPALNADLFGDASLAMELALSGRKVVFAAHPESFMGTTTDEYRNAIKDGSDPEPHVAYFKELINQLVPEGQEFELWGYSFGGSITAGLLRDPEIQERVKNAVLLCPAGVVDQKPFWQNPFRSLGGGIAHEFGQDLVKQRHKRKNVALSTQVAWSIRKDPVNDKRNVKLRGIMLRRMNKNLRMITEEMKVKEGGSILILSGAEDDITRSRMIHEKFSRSSNPQIHSVIMPGASHHTPIVDSPRVIDFIANQQHEA